MTVKPHPILVEVRALRLASRLTLGGAAALTGYPRETLSDWERGKGPRLPGAVTYAAAFDRSIGLQGRTPRARALLAAAAYEDLPSHVPEVVAVLAAVRRLRCESRAVVAGRAGVAVDTLHRWETVGAPGLGLHPLSAYAEALDCELVLVPADSPLRVPVLAEEAMAG